MKAAAGLATETRNDGIYPTSEALASQLRVNNPTIHYVGLYSADQIPGDPETIGVFTDKGRLILKARASDDSILIFDSASGSEFRKQPGNTRHDEKPQRGNY